MVDDPADRPHRDPQQPDPYRLALDGACLGRLFIVVVVRLGLIISGELAATSPAITSSTLATAMLAGTAIMAIAIALDTPWAVLAIAIGYDAPV